MFLIRDIMYCKPGKVRPLVETAVSETEPAAKLEERLHPRDLCNHCMGSELKTSSMKGDQKGSWKHCKRKVDNNYRPKVSSDNENLSKTRDLSSWHLKE